jgi:hypothetical protein
MGAEEEKRQKQKLKKVIGVIELQPVILSKKKATYERPLFP